MGYLFLPIATVLFCLGILAQLMQQSEAMPGAGVAGRIDSMASITAQQALAYGAACLATVEATPGLVGASIAPVLPAGMVSPVGVGCMAVLNPAGGRNVYGYMRVAPGASAAVLKNSGGSLAWLRVESVGSAVNLMTGAAQTVPAALPIGSLVHWIQLHT
ncbi:hypothetical protein [Cupriavidus sp. AU9028]|uniref:hypothetical protein n=1 Tax=Cupriavidus sp. AU9028 TaxID=2871157 RepID=UPI001C9484E7|nr:hypothetical protein [Cupriavidus sp. AU9028]MBY4898657.1 hypothetical protein [Cupriavidus sp. AU9028]